MNIHPKTLLLFFLSLLIVAFGQPALSPSLGLISATLGFSLIFYVLLQGFNASRRFWLGTLWFTLVQLVQLYWFTSHPYAYIYLPYFFLSLGAGIQFGIIALLITPERLKTVQGCLIVAALWTVMEWSRLFLLSGFSWNPVGLALASNDYARQLASVGGIFALSFWVILTNAIALRSYLLRSFPALWIFLCVFPYLFGMIHMAVHEHFSFHRSEKRKEFHALLVQTAFPTEESMGPLLPENLISSVITQWHQILQTLKPYQGKKLDLIVLPEFVVPFGTYAYAYPASKVMNILFETFGPIAEEKLPLMIYPYVFTAANKQGPVAMVNNAFIAQGIANIFNSNLLIGLEDAEDIEGKRHYFSSAMLFVPQAPSNKGEIKDPQRYEKRVLVPMGEYIPFSFCQQIAAKYGILSSFTCGTSAKIMQAQGVPFSPNICYEETFGHLMTEGKRLGAKLLVNLTSDAWYPNSTLPLQHFEHARMRTVENGVPLIRACNNGITSGIDSFGRTISIFGDEHPEDVEWTRGGLLVTVPLTTYWTLYSHVGDALIIGISLILIIFGFRLKNNKPL